MQNEPFNSVDWTSCDGWYIWRDPTTNLWSTDSGTIQVSEYLDDHGRYCLSIADPHVPDPEPFRYDAVVLDVELQDGSTAFLIDPLFVRE